MKNARAIIIGLVAILGTADLFPGAVRVHLPHRVQAAGRGEPAAILLA